MNIKHLTLNFYNFVFIDFKKFSVFSHCILYGLHHLIVVNNIVIRYFEDFFLTSVSLANKSNRVYLNDTVSGSIICTIPRYELCCMYSCIFNIYIFTTYLYTNILFIQYVHGKAMTLCGDGNYVDRKSHATL